MDIDDIENIEDFDNEDLFELLDQIGYEEDSKIIEDIEKLNYCSECESSDYIVDDSSQGIVICTGCGTILGSLMDKNPEFRNYDGDGKANSNHCSYTSTAFLPQSSLGTTIGASNRSKVKILHGWSAMPYKERSLNQVLKDIQEKCRKAGILKCIEDDAKILYKNISGCKHLSGDNKGKNIIIRGNNRKSLIAACVFFACKRKGKTRSQKEIGDMFGLKYTHVTKGCKTFLKLMKNCKMEYDFNSSTPEQFIYRFCRQLRMSKEYANQAVAVTKNIQKINIASVHTPLSVAAGSILLIAEINKIPLTKKLIASKFKVSEVTITKAYRKLECYKDIITNDELTEKFLMVLESKRKKSEIPDDLRKRYNNLDEVSKTKEENISIDSENIVNYLDDIKESICTRKDNINKNFNYIQNIGKEFESKID